MGFVPGQMWLTIVQHFTDCAMSVPDDKLLAISGIAAHYGTTTSDDYLAGFFRSSLYIISSCLFSMSKAFWGI